MCDTEEEYFGSSDYAFGTWVADRDLRSSFPMHESVRHPEYWEEQVPQIYKDGYNEAWNFYIDNLVRVLAYAGLRW